MTKTINMQTLRYMNLFAKISRVSPSYCFQYNNMLIFVVPKPRVIYAIGKDNSNLQKLSQILKKRIRVVAQPTAKNQESIKNFITTLVFPVEFNNLEAKPTEKPSEITITATRESKARLIGRSRIRQKELQDILEQYFGIKKISFI